MSTTLDWRDHEDGSEYAMHNGYRIRAVREDHAGNPFEDTDCNWPIMIRHLGGARPIAYEHASSKHPIHHPLARFSDHAIVHMQVHIAKILCVKIEVLTAHLTEDYGPEGVKYCHDGALLREQFQNILDDSRGNGDDEFAIIVQLYALVGIAALDTSTSGHSQGDYAHILVVATPEVIEAFGCTNPITPADLEATADLYGDWCWGNVYGYVIEKLTLTNPDEHEDGDDAEYDVEELDSCWGYYGDDHAKSGLEEAALEACPDQEKVDA